MLKRAALTLAFAMILSSIARADIRIDIGGADTALAENIRNHIGTISSIERERPQLLNQKLRNAVRDASQALGYYGTDFQYSLRDDTLSLQVKPGTAVLWSAPQFAIGGAAAQLPDVQQLLKKNPFTVGQRINHATYDNFKRQLLEICQEDGFLDARYAESRLLIDVERRRATAILHIEAGTRYRFGEVSFSGSSIAADVLTNLSPITPGSYYDKAKLARLQRNLQQSRYFRNIDVRPERHTDDRSVAIAVTLTDAPSHQFSIGAGYGTDTGPRAKFRWERPHVTSRGHKLATNLEVAQAQQTLNFEYHIPLNPPLDRSLNLSTSWEHTAVQDTSSTVGSVGTFFSVRHTETWTANYGGTLYDENYRQGSEPRRHTTYFAPEMNFTQLVLPLVVDPLSGHKAWLQVLGSAPALGAQTDFARVDVGYKQIFNTFGQQLLIGRIEFGAIATHRIDLIPASQRFFTGGDQTVRGYDYESLASTDATGQLIGGRYLNVASVEYSFKVAERWRTAVFTDAGRAFNNSDEPWHKSVGAGVRWLSPVGQIRVDLAFPVNDAVKGWRLHIFIGPPL